MNMPLLSPRALQSCGAVLVILMLASSILLALSLPWTGLHLEADEAGGLRVLAVDAASPARATLAPGMHLKTLDGLPLEGGLLIEEPDTLADWSAYAGLMAQQQALTDALLQGNARVQDAQGREWPLVAAPRPLGALPGLFWYQLAVGVGCFLIGFGVWVFRVQDRAARHFAVCGFSILLLSCCAGIYSTRELLIDGRLFATLSALNQLGAQLFTAALVSLLWHYPGALGRRSPAPLAYAAALLGAAAFAARWLPTPPDAYLVTLGLFAVSFWFSARQWRATRGDALGRAALKWYLLSIYLGTGLFAVVILLPVALNVAPPASQGVMFAVFLFMFVGIALGITRYRLFELDRWWFRAWSWFLGGVAVLALDALLLAWLDLGQGEALLLSLALLGWGYFPLRQWLWGRLQAGASDRDQARFGAGLELLAGARDELALGQRWLEVLQQDFRPVAWELRPQPQAAVVIEAGGAVLALPHPAGDRAVLLRLPDAGARLFGMTDVARADALWRMLCHVRRAMNAREEGVCAERGRILRDLHDDLGAKLLSLVYLGQGEVRELAREALQDMRDVVTALGAEPCALSDALAAWREEAGQRLAVGMYALDWQEQDLSPDLWLEARPRADIGRILREALNNVIKHASGPAVRVVFAGRDGGLELRVENATGASPGDWVAGTGSASLRRRASELGGHLGWEQQDGECRLRAWFPFATAA